MFAHRTALMRLHSGECKHKYKRLSGACGGTDIGDSTAQIRQGR